MKRVPQNTCNIVVSAPGGSHDSPALPSALAVAPQVCLDREVDYQGSDIPPGGINLPGGTFYDCHQKCEDAKDELHRIAFSMGDEMEEEPCERQSILNADSCDTCRQAFLDEFGVQPVGGCN